MRDMRIFSLIIFYFNSKNSMNKTTSRAELDWGREFIRDIDELLKLPVKAAIEHHRMMKYKASKWMYWPTLQKLGTGIDNTCPQSLSPTNQN